MNALASSSVLLLIIAFMLILSGCATTLETAETQESVDAEAFSPAVKRGDTETVRMLIKAGAEIDSRDNDGFTGLSVAALSGHMDIVQLLIEF